MLQLRAELIGRDTALAQLRDERDHLAQAHPDLPAREALLRERQAQAERLQVGQELTVNFTQASMESKVTVHSINHQGDSDTALLVMEGTEFSSEMVSMREQPIEIIIATYTGLKVPKSAVRVQEQTDSDGKTTQIPGVFILSGSIQKFKMINELFEADDYYVVEQSATNSDMLVERDQVIVQGKNLQNNMVVKT